MRHHTRASAGSGEGDGTFGPSEKIVAAACLNHRPEGQDRVSVRTEGDTMRRRWLRFAVVPAAFAFIAAACGDDNGGSSDTSASVTTQASVTTAASTTSSGSGSSTSAGSTTSSASTSSVASSTSEGSSTSEVATSEAP